MGFLGVGGQDREALPIVVARRFLRTASLGTDLDVDEGRDLAA